MQKPVWCSVRLLGPDRTNRSWSTASEKKEKKERKSYRLHQKTTQPNKWMWQNSMIQNQYSEIKGIFVHQQWNIRNRNQEKIPFAIAIRKINYLQTILTKEGKDLYSENYTTLKKEIKEDTNKWKHCTMLMDWKN